MACDIFHGTRRPYLPSIAEKGLLPRELHLAHGVKTRFPRFTKLGVVYVCDNERGAEHWGRCGEPIGYREATDIYQDPVVLCVDADVSRFDRKL